MAHAPTAGAPNSPSKTYFILAVTQTDTLLSMTVCRKPRPSIKISVLLWVLLNVLPPVRIAPHCLSPCCLQNHMCLQFCTRNKLGSHQTLSYNKAEAIPPSTTLDSQLKVFLLQLNCLLSVRSIANKTSKNINFLFVKLG